MQVVWEIWAETHLAGKCKVMGNFAKTGQDMGGVNVDTGDQDLKIESETTNIGKNTKNTKKWDISRHGPHVGTDGQTA